MPEFLKLLPPATALQRFLHALPDDLHTPAERVKTQDALGRALAEAVTAPSPLPPFRRSTVDGYAVRAEDTFGASASQPAYLRRVGEVQMGRAADLALRTGEAATVHTGGMIPDGADAVVMLEDTQSVAEDEIELLKAAAAGQNVLLAGEDVKAGEVVIEAGSLLRAQEIGGLLALGVTEIKVASQPRVAILSTGDEVVPPEAEPAAGQVRDVNSYTLSALVERAGSIPVRYGIIPDQLDALRAAARKAHAESEMVLIAAGSSVSARDITADVIQELGPPGVLVHGVALRPGKPTILALCGRVPVVGLPGNPVSAMVVAGLFVVPVLRKLLGLRGPSWPATLTATLAGNVASVAGREDYLPVRLEMSPEGLLAQPVYGRSNLIFTLVRADGLVQIPAAATGLEKGERVEVRLF
jgi:molybdopterin molybdotransferase